METQVSYEGQGVGDEAGKSVLMAQAKSSVSARISGQDQDDTPRKCTSGSLPATGKDDKKAGGKEPANAQAVKRGHQVTMIEVPDDEDDTSFRKWVAKGSPTTSPKPRGVMLPTPPESLTFPTHIPKNEVTSPTVATPSAASAKVKEVPHRWM